MSTAHDAATQEDETSGLGAYMWEQMVDGTGTQPASQPAGASIT